MAPGDSQAGSGGLFRPYSPLRWANRQPTWPRTLKFLDLFKLKEENKKIPGNKKGLFSGRT